MTLHQMPGQEAIDGAKAQFALPGPLPHVQGIQQPLQLGAAEIGVRHQAGLFADHLRVAVLHQLFHIAGRTAALPHDGVIQPFARLPFPQQGGFPLVGDADGGDLLGIDAGAAHRRPQGFDLGAQDVRRVVLHPAGIGIMLLEFLGRRAHHMSLGGKDDRAGGRGALIQGHKITLIHTVPRSSHNFVLSKLIINNESLIIQQVVPRVDLTIAVSRRIKSSQSCAML